MTAAPTSSPTGLPLVLDLTDRLVVAVGGGPVAARRVKVFLAEGARVRVVAPYLCEDLRDLVHEGDVAWHVRDYAGPADLAGAWLVHTATGDKQVDAAVATAAGSPRVITLPTTGVAEDLVVSPVPLVSMGRAAAEDVTPFLTAALAGRHAAYLAALP